MITPRRDRRRRWACPRQSPAALALLAAPARAQDSDACGIPPGPANHNGLNGSIAAPSGIGNASRMPPRPDPVPVDAEPSERPAGLAGIAAAALRQGERPAAAPRRRRHLPGLLRRATLAPSMSQTRRQP
jgi:hypothetical protein